MTLRRSLIPKGAEGAAASLCASPGICSGGHVFLTGMTGSLPGGLTPQDPETQFHSAFHKIGHVLAEAGLGHDSIVEMTSYHVGLAAHFDLFNRVRAAYVADPFPAWTAVEVAGLRRPDALVEIRVIAALREDQTSFRSQS